MINWNFDLNNLPVEDTFLILTKDHKVYHVIHDYEIPSYEETFEKFLYLSCVDGYTELNYDDILCWSKLNFPN